MTLVKRSKETNALLEGAVYTVSAVKWSGTAWEAESSTNNWSRDVTTDATGKGVLSLLTVDSRIYQIKEKTAPTGYQVDPTAYYVMFTNDAARKAANEALGVTVYAAPIAGTTVNQEITVSDAKIPTQPVDPGTGAQMAQTIQILQARNHRRLKCGVHRSSHCYRHKNYRRQAALSVQCYCS